MVSDDAFYLKSIAEIIGSFLREYETFSVK